MIKLFHSGMVGAPNTLNNIAGRLITVLDACLINGWGSAIVDSVVIDSGIATVTLAGHPFEADTVSLIAGATVTGGSINGEQKVLTATATTYTFAATGLSNQVASGTITHILAPLGFEKAYSGTNLAAYRSTNIDSPRHYLRVNDIGTTTARISAYEKLISISTGTNQYPNEAAISGGYYWFKSDGASIRPWIIIGDDRGFYFRSLPYVNLTHSVLTCYFGDFTSTKEDDLFASCITGSPQTISASTSIYDIATTYTNFWNSQYIARAWHGIGSGILARRSFNGMAANSGSSSIRSGDSTSAKVIFPNYSNGMLYISPIYIGEYTSGYYRGNMPGIYATPQGVRTVYRDGERIVGPVAYPNKRVIALHSGLGIYFIDLTGPWR